jgi:hypothetical protein
MNKLELLTKVVYADITNPELSEELKKATIATSLKTFAGEMLNLYQICAGQEINPEFLKAIMEREGMDFNLKTKKFS